MNKINYQLQLDKILDNLQKKQEIPPGIPEKRCCNEEDKDFSC